MPDLETEKEASRTNILYEFNKFNNEINNFDEMVRDKLNNDIKRLNKLNNNFKKIKNHVEENNDKIINKEKQLDHVKNESNYLFLKLNQSNEELNIIRNELYKTKRKLGEAGDDINEKTKYIDKLEEILKKYDYKNNKVKGLKSELDKKNN